MLLKCPECGSAIRLPNDAHPMARVVCRCKAILWLEQAEATLSYRVREPRRYATYDLSGGS